LQDAERRIAASPPFGQAALKGARFVGLDERQLACCGSGPLRLVFAQQQENESQWRRAEGTLPATPPQTLRPAVNANLGRLSSRRLR
jgi:hypothetical protein